MSLKDELWSALEEQNLEEVKELITDGADIDSRDTDGNTPLMFLLVNFGDIFFVNEESKTFRDLIELLIKKGADVKAVNNQGKTPLHSFGFCEEEDERKIYKDIAKILVSKGANINAKDNDGNTPLIIALDNFNGALAEYLIEINADVNASNNKGESPFSIVENRPELKYLLKKLSTKGADISSITNRVYEGWIVWMDVTYDSTPELEKAIKEASSKKDEIITHGHIWTVFKNEQTAKMIGNLLVNAGTKDPGIKKVKCYETSENPNINWENARTMENGWIIESC